MIASRTHHITIIYELTIPVLTDKSKQPLKCVFCKKKKKQLELYWKYHYESIWK